VDLVRFRGVRRNSEVRRRTFGVLDLRLRPGAYSWRFLRIPDGVARDAGTDRCR
jgi:hypothetical protein